MIKKKFVVLGVVNMRQLLLKDNIDLILKVIMLIMSGQESVPNLTSKLNFVFLLKTKSNKMHTVRVTDIGPTS